MWVIHFGGKSLSLAGNFRSYSSVFNLSVAFRSCLAEVAIQV